MILPGSVPLDSAKISDELATHLDDSWKPIVDADGIEAPRAAPSSGLHRP
jgi:hypothetical protein